jgi:acyl-CoA thioesterase FadM
LLLENVTNETAFLGHTPLTRQNPMPRIQHLPAQRYTFTSDIQIYISHVNQGGHLDNAQLLTLVSEARVRFFKSLGYSESGVEGANIVVGDIVAQYKSEGFHGETMRIEMATTDCNKYGFDLQFRMSEKDTQREVALGKIGIVFITQGDRKVTPIPPAFLAKVNQL